MSRPFGSPEDVDIALAAKPSEEPLIDPIEQDDGVDATLGWLYLLANRPDDAIPFLRRATVSCQFGNRSSMFAHTSGSAKLWRANERSRARAMPTRG